MEATTTVLAETKQAFHQPEWYFQKRGYHVQVRIETISEFLKGSQFGRMLDIGCGDGSISLPLLTASNRLTLLDMSDGMLARAKSRIPTGLSSNVDIFKSDFMGANLEPNSYDLIICLGVLAYIETPDLFLAKLASLLKPGGHLILEWTDGHHFVPRVFSIYERVLRLFRPPKVHLVCQNGGQLLATLNGLGFRTTGSFRYCSPLPVVRRLLGERLNYRLIRAVHGDAVHNRAAWLGDECIHHFRKTA
jgi:SAM-dependent methyltransferase